MEAQINDSSEKQPDGGSSKNTRDSTSKPVISGSCACNSVKWSSTHAPTRGSFCYCTICRQLSGGAFIAFMDLPRSSVNFSSSTLEIMTLSRNAERGFCTACGSTMTMRYFATPDTIYLTIASVDEAEEGLLEGLEKKHLYVGEQVDWYELPEDGLPRYETMPNEAKYLIFKD